MTDSTVDVAPRPDWRESLSLAADLALLGIVTSLACVPVVTAGGALATASVAVDHASRYRQLPSTMDLLGTFRRAVLPGLGATAVLLAVAAVFGLDLRSIATGRVPGGAPALIGTAVVGLSAIAFAGLVLVHVGTTGGRGWIRAARAATTLLWARPLIGPAIVAVLAVVALLASVLPVTAPLLLGMTLFALHTIARTATR